MVPPMEPELVDTSSGTPQVKVRLFTCSRYELGSKCRTQLPIQ